MSICRLLSFLFDVTMYLGFPLAAGRTHANERDKRSCYFSSWVVNQGSFHMLLDRDRYLADALRFVCEMTFACLNLAHCLRVCRTPKSSMSGPNVVQ